MIKVAKKVFLLKGYCNTYFIDDKLKVLIDAGFDFKEHVDVLILTHIHPDHIFYAGSIKKRTGCKILIGEFDNKVKELIRFFPNWDNKKVEEFATDKTLKQGDFVNTGLYNLEVIPAPGHTKGSICLFDKAAGLLFSGDVLFAKGLIGRTDLPHSEPDKMNDSLSMLEKLKYKILLPGHGVIEKKS